MENKIIINKYILGELSGNELENFKQMLQDDKALADKVDFHREIHDNLVDEYKPKTTVDEIERKEFKQILSNIMKSSKDKGKITRMIPWLLFSAAIGAVVLLLILPPNLSDLADRHFNTYLYQTAPNLGVNNLKEGIQAYKNQSYQKAVDIFNENPDGDLNLQIAKGNAEYHLQKYDDSINTFNSVIKKTGDENLKNTANWYLALTYLKKGDKQNAIRILRLQPENSLYDSKANSLLKDL